MTSGADLGYAGDVLPDVAWQWVLSGEAVLIDVRTDAERAWVGRIPGALPVAWKQWPDMAENPSFGALLQSQIPVGEKTLVMLCRSGVRSIAAAKYASSLGYRAFNILEGFEGDLNEVKHRGQCGGWRYRGLPWEQS